MDQKNDGPTDFDINRPHTYGATPSARPIITGHQPMMPDPMVTPQETRPQSARISVKVDGLSDSLSTMEGEPQLSPPFKPRGDGQSAAQRAPYMSVSDLTGIAQSQASASAKPTRASEISDEQVITTNPKPSVFGSSNHMPVNEGKASKNRKSRAKLWLWPLLVLIVLAAAYAAIDKGLILSNINLPVHIFKKADTATTSSQPSSPGTQASVPAGFTSTKLVEANLTFAYPTAWGAPTATTDQGFSKRSASAKADVNYAFVVSFATNKDVVVAITSGKFLPPARAAGYYDFLGWCVGTADTKYYAGVLRFAAAAGVDSPTTITCDQGPLNNVAKLTSDTIVQTNIKNADGSPLGDIYTKNLKNNDYVVARAKDATMKNGDLIQTMLGTIQNTQ